MCFCGLHTEVLSERLLDLGLRFRKAAQRGKSTCSAAWKELPLVRPSQLFTHMNHERNAAFRWSPLKRVRLGLMRGMELVLCVQLFPFRIVLCFSLLQEWRHAHGMRCLGIPNTAHFANVTQIEDAVSCK